jgi:hypothetical protein
MLFVNVILLFFKFVFLSLKTFSFYLLIVAVRGISFFIFAPFSLFYLIKSFVLLIFIATRSLFYVLLKEVANFSFYFYNVHLSEPFYQMLYHLSFSYRILKEKIFRRYYFYRRFYRFHLTKIFKRSSFKDPFGLSFSSCASSIKVFFRCNHFSLSVSFINKIWFMVFYSLPNAFS